MVQQLHRWDRYLRDMDVALSRGIGVLRAADDQDADLIDACGTDPNYLCERVFEATGGSETLARLADWFIDRPLSILLILVVSWTLSRFARRVIERTVRKFVTPDREARVRRFERLGLDSPEIRSAFGLDDEATLVARQSSRANSISSVLTSTARIAIWTIAIILILGELSLNLGPIIAGAGIAGIALGFGAQSLVKDFISGVFMVIEDQYGIGDVVDLGGDAVGVVEKVSLRTTTLRNLDGTVWHVPNGEIVRVGNQSQHWSTALVDIDVAYDSDLGEVRELLISTATRVCESNEWSHDVLQTPELLGVEMLGADGITFRMTVQTAAGRQWALQRALREAFKEALDAAHIEIPFPQRTVWHRNEQR